MKKLLQTTSFCGQGPHIGDKGIDLFIGELLSKREHGAFAILILNAVYDSRFDFLVTHGFLNGFIGVITDIKAFAHGRLALAVVTVAFLAVGHPEFLTWRGCGNDRNEEGGSKGKYTYELFFHLIILNTTADSVKLPNLAI